MGSQRSIDSFLKMKAVILLALFIAGCSALHGNIDKQIVSGYEAGVCEFPHMAYLLMTEKDGSHTSCGGALIDETHILTAAHCVLDVVGVTVHLGHADKTKAPQVIKGARWTHISGYRHTSAAIVNDVAMIRLERPAKLGPCVQTISLPERKQIFTGTCIAAGWGKTRNDEGGAIHMRKTPIDIIPAKQCRKYHAILWNQHICVGDRTHLGGNICQGDSGGPLMCQSGNKMVVAGVASYIFDCEKGFGVYANIPMFIDWVKQTQASL